MKSIKLSNLLSIFIATISFNVLAEKPTTLKQDVVVLNKSQNAQDSYQILNMQYKGNTEGYDVNGIFGPSETFFTGNFKNLTTTKKIDNIPFSIKNIKQVGHSDGVNKDGSIFGINIYKGDLKINNKHISDFGKQNYTITYSTTKDKLLNANIE